MSEKILISDILGTVFATTGVALPVIVAHIAYIGIRLEGMKQQYQPPLA